MVCLSMYLTFTDVVVMPLTLPGAMYSCWFYPDSLRMFSPRFIYDIVYKRRDCVTWVTQSQMRVIIVGLLTLEFEVDGQCVPNANCLSVHTAGVELGKSLDDADCLSVEVRVFRPYNFNLTD